MSQGKLESDVLAKRAVRTRFEEQLVERYPDLRPWKGGEVPKMFTCMAWPPDASKRVFVALLFGKYDAQFTIECGWVVDGHFPKGVDQYFLDIRRPDGSFETRDVRNGVRFRLGELRYPSNDQWWNPIGPRRQDRSIETVEEALRDFALVALPFIEQQSGLRLGVRNQP